MEEIHASKCGIVFASLRNIIPFEADVMKLVLGFLRFAAIGLFRTVCCKANTMVTNGLPAEILCPRTLDAFAGLGKQMHSLRGLSGNSHHLALKSMRHLHPETIRPWLEHWPRLEVSDEDADLINARDRLVAACKGLTWWLGVLRCSGDYLIEGWKQLDSRICCRIQWSGILKSPEDMYPDGGPEFSIYFPLKVHVADVHVREGDWSDAHVVTSSNCLASHLTLPR